MIEPFLGSGSPVWPGIPSPAFGWFQPPLSIGSRPAGAGPSAWGTPPFVGQVPVPPGVSFDAYGYGAFGVPGVIPALAGPEVPTGPTARGLLAAVAVRRGQPMGPTNDQEMEEFIYDAFDMLIGANDVEVRLEGGRATLTGSVGHKRVKRDVGEIAWAMPGISDVQNNVTISGRRRVRAGVREAETPTAGAGRKTA